MSRFYLHLSLDERRTIYQLLQQRCPLSEIAVKLGRHPSTIHREISRNRHLDEHSAFRGCFHVAAHDKASCRRLRGSKIVRDAALARYVDDRLSDCWSPEQIAGYLRVQSDSEFLVGHETIYRFVYGPQGRARQLWRLLPSQRRMRRRRYARRPRELQSRGRILSVTALLDRLTHHCHILESGNDSFRFRASSATPKTRKEKLPA